LERRGPGLGAFFARGRVLRAAAFFGLATAPSPPVELEFAFEPDADLDPLSLAFSDSDMKRLLYGYVSDPTSVSTGDRNATEIPDCGFWRARRSNTIDANEFVGAID
jgi:hypothetical protein